MSTKDTEGQSEALAIAIYEAVNDNASTRTPWAYLDPGEWGKWRRAANIAAGAQPAQKQCWCTTCRPITVSDMRFVVCPDCGNKRCPKAHNHANACTGSNEPGQVGSSWRYVKPSGAKTDRN